MEDWQLYLAGLLAVSFTFGLWVQWLAHKDDED